MHVRAGRPREQQVAPLPTRDDTGRPLQAPRTTARGFHIRTLGCKVNRAESEAIAAALIAHGLEQVGAREADVGIVNTCTVTGEADAKNRKAIRSLLRDVDGPVLVTGCAVNVDAGFYRDIDPRVVCVSDKDELPGRVLGLLASTGAGRGSCAPVRVGSGFRTRVDLKVQDGCDNACSFCIVHTARGPARSTSAGEVVEQVRQLAGAGVPEVVLVGIDLAAYRSDGLDLAGLLDLLCRKTDVGRLRVSSIEPQNLSPSLLACLAASDGRVARHLHLCLQSGSTRVLREMNRRYDAEQFARQVRELRGSVPQIALSTDVIVGFPGETDEDFEQTRSLVEECAFMRLHVFRYSKRPGTPAAERADQVDPQTATARARDLAALGTALAAADRGRRVGTDELVVVERPGRGTGESYHEVRFEADLAAGALVPMRFVDVDEAHGVLVGEPL